MTYAVRFSTTARRAITDTLPESVAAAALELIQGDLREEPYRIGRRLAPPLDDRLSARRGTYGILYQVDDATKTLTIVSIQHRRDAYRT